MIQLCCIVNLIDLFLSNAIALHCLGSTIDIVFGSDSVLYRSNPLLLGRVIKVRQNILLWLRLSLSRNIIEGQSLMIHDECLKGSYLLSFSWYFMHLLYNNLNWNMDSLHNIRYFVITTYKVNIYRECRYYYIFCTCRNIQGRSRSEAILRPRQKTRPRQNPEWQHQHWRHNEW